MNQSPVMPRMSLDPFLSFPEDFDVRHWRLRQVHRMHDSVFDDGELFITIQSRSQVRQKRGGIRLTNSKSFRITTRSFQVD
jgi:hypothetical protein